MLNLYKTDIKIIDSQHEKLTHLIEDLAANYNDENFIDRINKILEIGFYHVETEEQIMAEIGFNKINEHKMEHRIFFQKLGELKNQYSVEESSEGPITAIPWAIAFLNSWILNHILVSDMEYAEWYKDVRGL